MELQAWPVLEPHSTELNCLSSLMAGVLEGKKDESGYKSLGKLRMDKIGCGRISCKIDKKEGGESQLDVGGKE